MDLIPNLPVTKHGNRHLHVVVDYLTKWAKAFLPDMQAETIASVFLGESVARYGVPCSVHTDQGQNLDGNTSKFGPRRLLFARSSEDTHDCLSSCWRWPGGPSEPDHSEAPFPLCVQLPRRLGCALAQSANGLSLCRSGVDHIHTALPNVQTGQCTSRQTWFTVYPLTTQRRVNQLRHSGGCVSAWWMLMPLFARKCKLYIVIRKRISIAMLCVCRSLKATSLGCSPRLLALAFHRSSAPHGVVLTKSSTASRMESTTVSALRGHLCDWSLPMSTG